MTSCKTPTSPTRSRPPRRLCPDGLALACILALPTAAWAHGNWEEAIPAQPGLRLDAQLALSWYDADHPLPGPRLAGTLDSGQNAEDRRDFGLEHGVLGVGWRFNEYLGAAVGAGWHGSDPAHLEALWLNAYRPGESGDWELGAGRRRVPLGPIFDNAGNLDRFGLMPLAKRAASDGYWTEDGVNLRWRQGGEIPWEVDFGIWSGESFPGSDAGDPFPLLHVGADLGHVRVDGFAARLSTDGRASAIASGGHSHGSASCDGSLLRNVCFEGDVDVAGASARWHIHELGLELTAAGLLRRDRGDLYSASGDTRYTGTLTSGWLEAAWAFHPGWSVAARLEGLRGEHELKGSGASLVAREAGLLPEPGTTRRGSLALAWSPRDDLTLSAELGREENDLADNDFVGLRLLWRGAWAWPAGR